MSTNFAVPVNNASTTISVAKTTTTLPYTLTVTNGAVFSTALTGSQYYRVTICQVAFAYSPTATTANYTIYKADTISGNTIVLESVLEGTTDRTYAVGDVVEVRVTAGTIGDIQNAVNVLEAAGGGVAGSNTQFQYNNSSALAGSALLTQPNSSTVAIKGGTVGTVAQTITGATPGSVSVGTIHDILQLKRPSDGTVMGSMQIGNLGNATTTDYNISLISAVNFVAKPGPSPDLQAPVVQIYCDASITHALAMGAGVPGFTSGNDLYFSSYIGGSVNWKELFHCSALDVTAGSHVVIPIYSSGRNGIVIHGASGQTADLQQWTNSTPTTLSSVDANGVMCMVTQSTGVAPAGTTHAGGLIFDTSNFKLWAYTGSAWKSVTLA